MLLQFIFFSLFISYSANSETLSTDLKNLISAKYPDAKELASTPCELGSNKLKSIGLLIQKKDKEGVFPLVPLIAIHDANQWTLNELSLQQSYSKGSANNFLYDYWHKKKGFIGSYQIKCTDLKKDSDISTKANGEFTKNFTPTSLGRHLCFAASNVYNSWICYGVASTKKIENSFNQMNAD